MKIIMGMNKYIKNVVNNREFCQIYQQKDQPIIIELFISIRILQRRI